MKLRNLIFRSLPAALLPVAMVGSLPLFAAPPEQPVQPETPKSIFVVPESAKDGHDPFFPQSTRLFSDNPNIVATNTPSPVAITSLSLKSIVGGLAIINNHSFAPGEEGDVLISDGRRQHIRLVEIKSKTNTVVVEIGSQKIDLTLQTGL